MASNLPPGVSEMHPYFNPPTCPACGEEAAEGKPCPCCGKPVPVLEEVDHGAYSTPRTCQICGTFTTLSRDSFWAHVESEHVQGVGACGKPVPVFEEVEPTLHYRHRDGTLRVRAVLEAIAEGYGARLDPEARGLAHRRGWAWYVLDSRGMILTKKGKRLLGARREEA